MAPVASQDYVRLDALTGGCGCAELEVDAATVLRLPQTAHLAVEEDLRARTARRARLRLLPEHALQERLAHVRQLDRRRRAQLIPLAACEVILRRYLLAEERAAVSEMPPLRRRRSERLQPTLEPELSEDLDRARVDEVSPRM